MLPVIAAFIAISAPRAVPMSGDLPLPRLSRTALRAAEEADLRRVERLRDAAPLEPVDAAFGLWNESETEGSPIDGGRALHGLEVAWRRLSRDMKLAFLAERSQRFVAVVHRVREAEAAGREDRESMRALRTLAGGNLERRAMQSGLLEAEDAVLAAAFKLRLLLAAAPGDVALVPVAERIAFNAFIALHAKGQSIDRRLRAVREIGALDRRYPVHLAMAQLHALGGRWDEALAALDAHPERSVRLRNHRLWLARQTGVTGRFVPDEP